ncbi:hypothetical protein ABIA30_002933 [Mycobacterium sp. MAA66]|uniref:hypothetical protein n=1 Tax=Mycobacterium sp. MAA66 TaxID=3156297 RepID=UPI003514DB2C
MGRIVVARSRRLWSAVLTVAGAGVFVTAGGSVVKPPVSSVVSCCTPMAGVEVLALPAMPASRYRIVPAAAVPQFLPIGVAPERGLQVRTILAERAVSAAFPEIHEMGGVRPDVLRWHPEGLALDVMVPNPGSAAGIALGNRVVAYALKNAARFGLQDAIWRGVYYTPTGSQSGNCGHFDHVHLTTTGGGYPTGGEVYLR